MPKPSKAPFASNHHHQRNGTLLRDLMDRKTHSFSWPYSYPPFTSGPGWFSVNGVGYQPQFPGGGSGGNENIGVGVPIWFSSPGLRSMPAMPLSRQQPASQAQEANGSPSNSDNNVAAAATGATPAVSPSRRSPHAADNANSSSSSRNYTSSALVAPRPSSPMSVDTAMQSLSGHLHDAIRLCTACLKTHAGFVAKVNFTTAETRNGVWKDLLEHKFRSSGFCQDGFHNLGRRLAYYMDQAHCAAQNDHALKSVEQEKWREAEHRVRFLRLLRGTCDEVVKLSDRASVDVLDCKVMLGLMNDMKKKLDGKEDGSQDKGSENDDGEDDGNSGEAQPAEP